METHTIESIREAERKSHTSIYTSAVLFEKGTWLSKFACLHFSEHDKLRHTQQAKTHN